MSNSQTSNRVPVPPISVNGILHVTSNDIKVPGGGLPVVGPIIGDVNGALGFAADPVDTVLNDLSSGILSVFGIKDFKDLFQRLGLILFGAGLLFVGIRMLSDVNRTTVTRTTTPSTDFSSADNNTSTP